MAEAATTNPLDAPSDLTLILDLSPNQWHLSSLPTNEYPLSLEGFLPQVFAFINAHLAGRHENIITVFGAFPGKSVMLYSSEDNATTTTTRDANVYQPFRTVDTAVADRIREHLAMPVEDASLPIGLVGAITKGLCHLNKMISQTTATEAQAPVSDPRMLILSVSPDMSASYIPIMNSIFAAQKLKVKIDVCKIYGQDTVFLQQAAHLTGGSYVPLARRDSLIQYLVMCFLASSSIRQILALPTQDRVDLRAACFCHKTIVDIGYVCSVCLSIFCSPKPVCSTCRTKFPMATLRRYGFGAGRAPSKKSASSTPQPS